MKIPEGLTDEQINPQPAVFPQCECGEAFILRRGLSWMTGEWSWYWQKDCKHDKRKAQPGHVIIGPDGVIDEETS